MLTRAKCPYCGEDYVYPRGRIKPATCGKPDCVDAHHLKTTMGKGAIDRMLDGIEKNG